MTRWQRVLVLMLAMAMLAFAVGAGCSERTPRAAEPAVVFDAARAWADLETQVAMGFRVPGTPTHREVRDWLADQLRATGATVMLQPFSHELGGSTVQMWNIIAEIPGHGPAPRERVLLAAHWDTRPTADKDPDPAKRDQPIPGANDGASGVAVLLEIARQLQAHPISRDVQVVLFDGEDYGPGLEDMLLGSAHYARNLPEQKPDWGILLDMIGDTDLAIPREPYSEQHAKAVNDRVFAAARRLGYLRTAGMPGFVDAPGAYMITDDHVPLNEVGIPTVDLIDFDYPYWHTLADTPAKCSRESLRIVGMVVLSAIQAE